jgi:ribose 5-phosphate isomerase A
MKWETRLAKQFEWSKEISNRIEKEKVAEEVAARVKDGDVIGMGSGSTSFIALQAIGRRIKENDLNITAIPAASEVSASCLAWGIPVTTLDQKRPDWGFDGADEVDPHNSLIKGRGGALFKEKLVIASSPLTYILVDTSKLVTSLGSKFPVPVEVYPTAIHLVETGLTKLGAVEIQLRPAGGKDGPVITEAGNVILDTRFNNINSDLEKAIKAIPGVIESGLFIGYPIEVIVTN